MSEQLSLRWNDFHTNLTQSFQALLDGEDLADVTLAAEGQYIHAHKLILSVCSPYFKELFKMNPCDHPIVILKDVAHQELKQILQYMYCGVVNIRQQDLVEFLHTAELLQIKGLTSRGEHSESQPLVSDENREPDTLESSADSQTEWVPGAVDTIAIPELPTDLDDTCIKENTPRSPLKLLTDTPNENNCNIKEKPPIAKSPTQLENTECEYNGEPLIDFDSDLFTVSLMQEPTKETSERNCKSSGVKCPSCHRYFANRFNLRVHIRDKHITREGTLKCNICQKRMKNPSCLRVHLYHHRKQAAYLSQASIESSQIREVAKNIVGNKRRSTSSVKTCKLKNGEM